MACDRFDLFCPPAGPTDLSIFDSGAGLCKNCNTLLFNFLPAEGPTKATREFTTFLSARRAIQKLYTVILQTSFRPQRPTRSAHRDLSIFLQPAGRCKNCKPSVRMCPRKYASMYFEKQSSKMKAMDKYLANTQFRNSNLNP